MKQLLIYTAHLIQAFYGFCQFRFVLSQAELSVVVCFNSPCLLFAVGFYSHEQWLCLFSSFEPWLARPTCIYGFGDDLLYAYSCHMSVQFFDRLYEWSNALGTGGNALFLGTWPFSLFLFFIRLHIIAHKPDLRKTCGTAPPQL